MLSALSNILKITELRQKVVFTLAMFLVFRAGTHIPVPGVNTAEIEQLFTSGNLFGLLDLFSGGALSKFSVFAMSITPYINASIIMQLLTVVVPKFEQWAKEGEEGRKKITQITRYGTVLLGFIQAIGMAFGLKVGDLQSRDRLDPSDCVDTYCRHYILDVAGRTDHRKRYRQRHFADHLRRYRVPPARRALCTFTSTSRPVPSTIFNVILFLIIAVAMIVFVIAIQQGQRKIPVQYAKRVVGRKMYGGHSTHIPLKVNQAGVIPIIFASSVLMFPVTIAQFIDIEWVKIVAGYFAWGTPLQTTIVRVAHSFSSPISILRLP